MAEQLGKFVAPKSSGKPASPVAGQLHYDTATNTLYFWNGTEWVSAKGGGEPTIGGAFTQTIGDGTTTTFTIEHKLGTRAVFVGVRQAASPYQQVWGGFDHEAISTSQIKLTFDEAPTTNQYTVVVMSGAGPEGPKGPAGEVSKAELESLAILKALLTTKGDLIAATAASTPARLGVGGNFARLVADSGSASGVKWGGKDYGVVEALPTSPAPAIGDRCTYKAAAGVYWDLVYTGEETYPWAKIGGPALLQQSNVERTTASEAYVSPTEPLKITLPLKGDYDIRIEASVGSGATQANQAVGRISYTMGATAANNEWAAVMIFDEAGTSPIRVSANVSCMMRQTGRAASELIEEKIRSESNAITMAFIRRRLIVDPVRVG